MHEKSNLHAPQPNQYDSEESVHHESQSGDLESIEVSCVMGIRNLECTMWFLLQESPIETETTWMTELQKFWNYEDWIHWMVLQCRKRHFV